MDRGSDGRASSQLALARRLAGPVVLSADPFKVRPTNRCVPALIRTIIYDKLSGSTKVTTHLDHVSHCEITSGTSWLNGWTYRVLGCDDLVSSSQLALARRLAGSVVLSSDPVRVRPTHR